MKKSYASMLLLFCLATPFAATFLCLNLRQGQIHRAVKHQMMRGMDREELVLLSFDLETEASQLRWEHAAEFEYRGRMYDVVESEQVGDTVRYWCWADDEETQLNRQVREIAASIMGHNPQNRDSQTRLVNFCKSLFHAPTRPWQAEPSFFCQGIVTELALLPQFACTPPGPPPRMA